MLQSRAEFIGIAIVISIIGAAHGQNKALKALSVYNIDISRLKWQEFDNAAKRIENIAYLNSIVREEVLNSKHHLNLISGHHSHKISQRIIEWCAYANSTFTSVPLDNSLRQRVQQRIETFYNDIVRELGELLRELHSSSIPTCSSATNQSPFKISIELYDKIVKFDIIYGTPANLDHIFQQLLQQLKKPNTNLMRTHHSFQFTHVRKEIPYCRIQLFIESAIVRVERVLSELAAMTDASPSNDAIQQILIECKTFWRAKHSTCVVAF